ncbi:MAG: hypothetical protein P9L99_11510 [Candidatus Lernaella stagnicola]|nr:hypothetical protein [Candidatus Lernaella stagnicola]
MRRLSLIVVAVLLAASAATAEDTPAYPSLSADIYFHALYVSQENFRANSDVFGRALNPATGNFNNEIETEAYKHLVESRFRLFLTTQFSEDVLGRFTFEVNPEYGREQGFGDFRVNNDTGGTGEIRIKHFYIQAEHEVGGYLGYRIGRQGYGTPNSLVVGDPDAEGAAFWYRDDTVGQFTIAGAVVDTRETQRIEDVYSSFSYQFPQNPFLSGSFYLCYLRFRDRTAGDRNSPPEVSRGGGTGIGTWLVGPSNADFASQSAGQLFWAGLQLLYTQHNVALDFNAVLNFGNLDPGRIIIETAEEIQEDEEAPLTEEEKASYIDTVQGSLFLVDLSYGRTFWRVGAAGAFVSGHKPDPDATRYSGYLDVNADFTFTRLFFDGGPYLVSTGFVSPGVQGSGLIGGKVYTRIFPTDWLELNLQAAALAAQFDRPVPADPVTNTRYDEIANGAGSYYGTELDFWLLFTPADKLHWLAEVDYFLPGNYWQGEASDGERPADFLKDPDPAWRLAGGFLFY